MASKNKKSTKKLSFRKTSPLKMLLAVVVVSAVAGIGTYLLTRSNAATVGPRMFMAASNTTQEATFTQFNFGIFGDKYVAGDWNKDGKDTLGVYRPSNSTFYLTNSNSDAGVAGFGFGNSGDIPIAGDWDGIGGSTFGVYRPAEATFYLAKENKQGGGAVETFVLGNPGDVPITCDWNGDGITDLGLFRRSEGKFYMALRYGTWGVFKSFYYGNAGITDIPVCGNWDNSAANDANFNYDTVGVYRGVNFYLKNTNDDAGNGIEQRFGQLEWLPLVGRWTGTTQTLIGAYSLGGATIPDPIAITPTTSTTIDGTADQCAQKTLRKGNTGSCITILQWFLAYRGHPVVNTELSSKTFGQSTFDKVKEFQYSRSISRDGVVGPQTWGQLRTDTSTVVGPLSPTLPTLAANMAGAPENRDEPVKYCQALSAAILKVVQNADAIEAIFDVRWKPGSNSVWRSEVGTTVGTRLYWTDKKVRLNTLTLSDCTKRDSLIAQNISRLDQAKALKDALNNAYGILLAKILLGQ